MESDLIVSKDWVDFMVFFETDKEDRVVRKEYFERLVKDSFEAVQLDEEGVPRYIFTKSYVVFVLSTHIKEGDIFIIVSPRNY